MIIWIVIFYFRNTSFYLYIFAVKILCCIVTIVKFLPSKELRIQLDGDVSDEAGIFKERKRHAV
jgi:hypothetical protein